MEARANEEKRQRQDLAALAIAIAANVNREKINVGDIYKLVVREPMNGEIDEELEEAIYQESKMGAIKDREAEIRKMIDRVMACPK